MSGCEELAEVAISPMGLGNEDNGISDYHGEIVVWSQVEFGAIVKFRSREPVLFERSHGSVSPRQPVYAVEIGESDALVAQFGGTVDDRIGGRCTV
jgi:hypothetical protein